MPRFETGSNTLTFNKKSNFITLWNTHLGGSVQSSLKYINACPFFLTPFFFFLGATTTVKSWIFRARSRKCNAILSFEYCCQNSHAGMTAWPDLFPSSCVFLFSLLCFFFSVFPPLPALRRVFLPSLWLTLKDRVPCSVCHCLSAEEYQWPAAQSNQSLGGRSTVCLTSASLIIVSKHEPINSCHRLHPTATKTLASYLKPPVFEVIQAVSTAARSTSPSENCGDGFLNGAVEKRDYLFWSHEYNFGKITARQLNLWSF